MTRTWLLMAQHVPADGRGGGIVRYTVEFARAMAARGDVALSAVCSPTAAPFFHDLLAGSGRVFTERLPIAAVGPLAQQAGRGTQAYRLPFDVVHGVKHLLPRRARGRTVLTVHDFLALDRPGDFGPAKRIMLPGPYLRSVRRADVTLCVSAATRARLASYAPDVVSRSAVVPLAGAGPTAQAAAVPRLQGTPFALVVGDASARKNLPLLTRNWARVRSVVPEAVLAVVGPTTWGSDNRGSPAVTGVEQLGFVSDEELEWCYRNAVVALCPAVMEGFGLPALEALRRGVPVITSEDPALCEVTGSAARHLHTLDEDGWVTAIVDAFRAPTAAGGTVERSWGDVVEESIAAVFG